jgi:hypothetical protein
MSNVEKVFSQKRRHLPPYFFWFVSCLLRILGAPFSARYYNKRGTGHNQSVVDLIEGKMPKRVGARHYTKLLRQADMHYAKYAKYLDKLKGVAKL